MSAKHGKMLGQTWPRWKLKKGYPPCNCPDCQQDTWGLSKGEAKRYWRGQLRTVGKRQWKEETKNPEFGG